MRTFSTPESVLKGEITKLGIIECALAVAVYIAIALRLHTFRYFYLAIAIAPLTLFRTEESTLWTLRAELTAVDKQDQIWLNKVAPVPDHIPSLFRRVLMHLYEFILVFVFLPALPLFLRVVGMIYGFARWPVRTIVEMPRNWVRQALCTDFAHPPEALPGELSHEALLGGPSHERLLGQLNFLTFPRLFSILDKRFARSERLFDLLLNLFIGVVVFLPPLLYRISFKASAVCYVPFLWVAQATAGSTLGLKVRLERVTKGELEKVRRWLAVFVLGVFGVVSALHFGVIDLTSVTSKFPTELAALNFIGVMKSFQWWHATLLADALLTFWLLFFSDVALARMDTQAWSEPFVANTLSMTSFFRGALAVLTMTHFCWVAILNVVPAGVRGFLSVL